METRMEVLYGLSNKRLIWPQPVLTVQPANRQNLIWHHSPGHLASHLLAGWLHWTLPSCCFIFTGIDTSLDMDLPSLSVKILPKPSPLDLWNTLFNIIEFHTTLPLTDELILQPLKCGNGLVFIEFTELITLPITLKQLAWWNSVKSQRWCQLDSNTFRGWNDVFRISRIIWLWDHNMIVFSP